MKRLVIYIFAFFFILLILSTHALYKIEFFKKDILHSRFTTSSNVITMNNSLASNEKSEDEKMIYTKVNLKKNTEYLVESDLRVSDGKKDTFYLIIDFMASGWDKDEHERKITIDKKRNSKRIFSIINSTNLPGDVLFRVFHYYNGFVEIKNPRLCEINSTATILNKSGYYLLFCFGMLIVFQLFGFRKEIHHALGRLKPKFKYLSTVSCFENPAALLLVCAYLLSVIVRFAVSILMEVPLIASDELNYKNMAYSFFQTGSFYSTEQYFEAVNIPNILYPWFISICFYFKENFYIAIKLLNSLVINLSVFPLYLMAKEFSSEKRALILSIMILMLPTMNYVNFAMADSLYFTLYFFCVYFVYKGLTIRKSRYNILTGIFLALLLLTKPNAVAFLLSFVLVSIFFLFYYRHSKEDFFRVLSSSIYSTGSFFIAFVILSLLFKGDLSYDIGLYERVVKKSIGDEIFSIPFISMIFAHLSTFLNLYCFPFLISLWALHHFYLKKDHNKIIFLVLGLVLFIVKIAMTFKFTLDISEAENFKRLHARYYFMTFPFFLISFVCFCDQLKWNNVKKIILAIFLTSILAANIFYFYPEYVANGLLIVDNPDLTWFLIIGKRGLVLLSILYLLTAIYYIKGTSQRYLPYVFFFVISCLISNYGEAKYSLNVDKRNKSTFAKYIFFIKSQIKDTNSNVAIIDSEWAYRLQTAFWLPYRYMIVHDISGGSKITRDMIPMETEYIIMYDDYNLDFSLSSWHKAVNERCSILHLK